TIRTNGFAVFDRWNNATYTNTTFTGLEGVEGLDDIEVKTCYMALNNPHANDVTYDHCTFQNMRSWGMLVAGEELTVTNCTFDGTNQSRAISVAYGTIDKCTITGNTFDLSGSGSGIMFSDAVTKTSTITVADNTFKNCNQEGGYCVNNTGKVEGEQVAPITVTGSTFIDCTNKYLNQVNVEEAAASDAAYVVSGNTETYYETLAEAISAAPSGSAVYLLKDISETVSVSKNISIYTNGHAFSAANIQCAANYYVRQISGGYEVYYSAPSTGSGGDSDPSYSPILDVGNGGSVKVNPRTPEEGDKVTITPDPDSGYEVDEVIVTDRNGREIDVTANRDGTYTFEQPRGRVTIEVTFTRTGESAFFTDVPETFWAYDEIAWAYDNGYVNGTTATTFSPNGSITRQQVWMILARLSGQSPANMAEARTWAMDNGISDGTNPGAAVTRQQLVALLYRFAELRNYANDQRADLSAYPDAGSVADYAVEPLQWSVANGI
ncbi:S-layer homology domain-containing protein, partial [Oscillibacter sp.]|uniref:S-layer homology domain-containing protein n=1 Tax=Oscillibacter sp. TaxID=1945593 RepID=UPI002D7E4D19